MNLLDLPQRLLSRWAAPRHRPLGLELGSERVNLVQFAQDADGLLLRAAASEPYPQEREAFLAQAKPFRAWLRGLLSQHGFAGRQVVTCLPSSALQLFPVSVNVPEGGSHEQAIALALRQRLTGDLAQSVVDYLPIRNEDADTSQRDALVAVAPRAAVMAHLQRLEAAGLEIVALEVGPAALARLVSLASTALGAERYPHVLAINFGSLRSHVSVIWGRRLVLDREIDFAEKPLVERVAQVLELNPEMARRLLLEKGLGTGHHDADRADPSDEFAQTLVEVLRPQLSLLVSEINRTLIYTASRSRGRGIDQIYLLGSVGRYPGVDALLQNMLSVPVRVLNPFEAFRSTLAADRQERLRPMAGMAVASGLALRGLVDHA